MSTTTKKKFENFFLKKTTLHMYTYVYPLLYGRNQHNIVKQLCSNFLKNVITR